tara:strand:- start:2776 stop:3087 length:312 start_codon:yes stop_codon:yes gene_type:complete
MEIFILIFFMTLITFSIRATSLFIFSLRTLSPLTMRFLSLVPVAMLSALCGPLIFKPNGYWSNPINLIEFWAALVTVIIARYGALPAIMSGIIIYVIGYKLGF